VEGEGKEEIKKEGSEEEKGSFDSRMSEKEALPM
jgi:hypothetical protein